MARYNSDGTLDTSFGTDGIIITNSGGDQEFTAIAVEPDGKIVAAGSFTGYFGLARYDTGVQRLYVAQDANWNVTALIGTDGYVKERFQYTPYGQRTVLSANWTAATDQYAFLYGHQGGRTDPATGLIHFRHRDYNPVLGTWMQQDPAQYIDGMSLYQFVHSNPIIFTDSAGLSITVEGPTIIGKVPVIDVLRDTTSFDVSSSAKN
jgi:RHS repeat-associated protein